MKAFDYQPVFNKSRLKNGVRIISEHHPNTRATSVGFFIDIGTRDEPSNMIGAAHFLEHLLFKGTENRTAYDIVKELEAVGGEINAYTSKEFTCFYATTLREHVSISLDVLSDLITHATIDKNEFVKERQVIEQEIDMVADDHEEYIFDLYFEKAYAEHPLSRPILGTRQSLDAIDRDQLFEFYHQAYAGENLIVAIAGDVNHEQLVEEINKRLEVKSAIYKKPITEKPEIKSFSQLIQKPAEQVHSLISLPASTYHDRHRLEAFVLNAYLGSGMTSRLYQRIREEEALAYSTYSYHHCFLDSGLMMIYTGSSEKSVPRIFEIVAEELKSLKEKGLSAEQVNFYKTQVMGSMVLNADDIENRMNSIALNEMIFAEYRSVDQILSELDAVNSCSIDQYVQDFMTQAQPGWLVLGDVQPDLVKNLAL